MDDLMTEEGRVKSSTFQRTKKKT